jgi:hypothetical protein
VILKKIQSTVLRSPFSVFRYFINPPSPFAKGEQGAALISVFRFPSFVSKRPSLFFILLSD